MMSRIVAGWYEDGGFDLLLTPSLGELPPPLGSFDDSGPDPLRAIERAKLTASFSGAFNVTGQPAISLPLVRTDDGLPVGIQLVAPLGREDTAAPRSRRSSSAPGHWAGFAARRLGRRSFRDNRSR